MEENQDQGVSERDKTVSIQSIVSSFVGVTDSRQKSGDPARTDSQGNRFLEFVISFT